MWEGSKRCVLDVLRALGREPRSINNADLLRRPSYSSIYDARFETFSAEMQQALTTLSSQDAGAIAKLQRNGRVLVENLALMLQASVLLQHAPSAIAQSFVDAKLGEDAGQTYGVIPADVAFGPLIERA